MEKKLLWILKAKPTLLQHLLTVKKAEWRLFKRAFYKEIKDFNKKSSCGKAYLAGHQTRDGVFRCFHRYNYSPQFLH